MMGPQDQNRESLKLLLEKGVQYYEEDDMKRCLACCDAILHSDPHYHQALNLAGLAFLKVGDANASLQSLNKAFMISKEEEYLVNIAEILRRCFKVQEAFDILMSIQNKEVDHYYFNLAKVYTDLGQVNEAIACYEQALNQSPEDADIIFNLANLWSKQDTKIACKYYQKAYQLGSVNAGINLALMWNKEEKHAQALKLYQELEHSQPNNAVLHFNYANLLSKMSFSDSSAFMQAKKYYKKALQIEKSPLYALNYSRLLLRFGEIKEGFKYAEARLELDIVPEALKPYVKNHDSFVPNQTLLLYAEQGYGDSLIFLRFVPVIAQKSKKIIVLLPEPLIPLVKQNFIEFPENVAFSSDIPHEDFDRAISLMSLPFILKINQAKDLLSPLKVPRPIAITEGMKPKIAFCFKSNPKAMAFKEKSIPLETLLSSFALQSFDFYCLQLDCTPSEKECLKNYGVQDLGEMIHDFSDTQRLLHDCHAFIGIDSAVTHLSATLGLKTFVLLHRYYDWRFADLDGKNLFYHDNVYRCVQTKLYDWKAPLKQLQQSLNQVSTAEVQP